MEELIYFSVLGQDGIPRQMTPNTVLVAVAEVFRIARQDRGDEPAQSVDMIETISEVALRNLVRSRPTGGTFLSSDVRDQVLLTMQQAGLAGIVAMYRLAPAQDADHVGQHLHLE